MIIHYEGKDFIVVSPRPELMPEGFEEAVYEDDKQVLTGYFKRTVVGWECYTMGHYIKRNPGIEWSERWETREGYGKE